AARQFDFHLRIACPEGYEPDATLLAENAERITLLRDPQEAVRDADLVVTDVWASMGQEAEQKIRETALANYQVSHALMGPAKPDASLLQCQPAHRREELSRRMLDDRRSQVWYAAETRVHAQKAPLEFLLCPKA